MTAWQRLIARSTLATGTAWEHLTNQGGGGASIVSDGISVAIQEHAVSILLSDAPLALMANAAPIAIVLAPPTINIKVIP